MIAKTILSLSFDTLDDILVPKMPPSIPPPIKSDDISQFISPLKEYRVAVKKPKELTEIKEVPTASVIVSPDIVCIKAGTIINPPPIPKYPAPTPTIQRNQR